MGRAGSRIPSVGISWDEIKSKLETEGAKNKAYDTDLDGKIDEIRAINFFDYLGWLHQYKSSQGERFYDEFYAYEKDPTTYAYWQTVIGEDYQANVDYEIVTWDLKVNRQWHVEVRHGVIIPAPNFDTHISKIQISSDGQTWTDISTVDSFSGQSKVVEYSGDHTFRYIRWVRSSSIDVGMGVECRIYRLYYIIIKY